MKFENSALTGCVLASIAVGAAVLSQAGNIPIFLVLPGLLALGVFGYVAVRSPQLFLVAAAFTPQWKASWPFSSVDRIADLTMVMLGCVMLAICWRLLKHLSRIDHHGITQMFLGQSRIISAFMFFVAVVAMSDLYTTAPEYGSSKLFRMLGIGTLLLISPLFLIRNEDEFRRFMRTFVVFALVTVVQLVGGLQTSTTADGDVTRIGAGWLVGMAIIIVLFYPLCRSESNQRLLMLFSLPILVVGLLASVARGPMVALFLILLIRMWLWFRHGQKVLAVTLAGIFAISAAGAVLVVARAGNNKFINKSKEMVRLVQGDDSKGSASARVLFYQAALPAIPEHFLLGRGVGSWSVFYFGRDERGFPHNMLVEVIFEEGVLGLAALLLLFATVYSSLRWLTAQTQSHYLVLGMVILFCVIVAMFSGDLDDNRLLWLWFGLTMAVCRNLKLEQVAVYYRSATRRVAAGSRILSRPSLQS